MGSSTLAGIGLHSLPTAASLAHGVYPQFSQNRKITKDGAARSIIFTELDVNERHPIYSLGLCLMYPELYDVLGARSVVCVIASRYFDSLPAGGRLRDFGQSTPS